MSFDRVRETSTSTGTGNIALGGAPTGFRAFASVYTPGGGVTLQYVVEGVDALGAQTGEWEVGQGVIVAGPALQRSTVTASSNGGALVAFTSAELRVYDGVTVDAVTDIANVRASAAISALGLGSAATTSSTDYAGAAAFTTHTSLTSGAHGLTAYGVTIAGAADASAARTALGTEGVYLRLDAANGPVTNTIVSSKSAPSVSAPTYTTSTGVDLWMSAGSGAGGRGFFVSASTSASVGDGVKVVGSSASLAGRTSVVVETGVTAVNDRYALRVDGGAGAVLLRVAGNGSVHFAAASDASPPIASIADPTTGVRFPAVGEMSHVVSGVERWRLTSTAETHQVAQSFVSGHTTEAAGPVAVKQATVTTLSADVNDYALGAGASFRISSDASRTVTGIAGGVDGRIAEVVNVGVNPVVFAHDSTSSVAANRVLTFSAASVTVPAGGAARFVYDATSSRWRLVSLGAPSAATIADGSVTTAKLADGAVSTAKMGVDVTTAGKALLDDADASAQRTTLGLPASATRTITSSTSTPTGGVAGDIHFQTP
jgi:hypothetical protein